MKWPFTDLEKANEEINRLRKLTVELTERTEKLAELVKETEALVNTQVLEYHELQDRHTRLIGEILKLWAKYGGKPDDGNQD